MIKNNKQSTLLFSQMLRILSVLILILTGLYFSGKLLSELGMSDMAAFVLSGAQTSQVQDWLGLKSSLLLIGIASVIAVVFLLLWRKYDGQLQGQARLYVYSAVFAFCSAASLCFFVGVEVHKSVFRLVLAFLLFYFYKDVLCKPLCSQAQVASMLLGILFGFFSFFGFQLANYGRLEILYIPYGDVIAQWLLHLLGIVFLFTAMMTFLFSYCMSHAFRRAAHEKAQFSSAYKAILCLGGLIFFCYLPYYIAFFPGILTADSINELGQCINGIYSNHHPVMHMLLIKPFVMIGQMLGSITLGIGLYSLFQMVIMSFVFALCIWYLEMRGAARWLRFITFAHYALFFIHAFYSVTMWKDVLFGGASLFLMLLLLEEVRTEEGGAEGSGLPAKQRTFLLILGVFLFCTLRNNGFHAFILGYPFFIIANRKQWKRLLAAGCAAILLVVGYQQVLFGVLGIEKSRVGEALSVPLQQIARSEKDHGDDFTQEDYARLAVFFTEPESLDARYTPTVSDPVKDPSFFRSDVCSKNPLDFAKLWLDLGLRYPLSYIEAFLMQNYGYWYPDVNYWQAYYEVVPNNYGVTNPPQLAPLRLAIFGVYYVFSEYETPDGNFLSPFFSLAFMIWLLIASAALLCIKGQGKTASPLFLLAALYLTTLASPLFSEYRYIYGVIICVPLFLALSLCMQSRGTKVSET